MTEESIEIEPIKRRKWWKRLLIGFLVFFILLLGVAYAVFKSARVQTYLAQKVIAYLNKNHQSKISIEGVDIKLLDNALALKGLLVLDYKSDTLLYVNELTFDVDSFGLDKHFINSQLLKVNTGLMDIKVYKGDSVNTFAFFLNEFNDPKDTSKSPQWNIYSKSLSLKGFEFRFDNQNSSRNSVGVDFSHLLAKNINGDINDLSFAGDSLLANISNLSFREKSGFQLRNLSTKINNSSHQLVLNSLNLNYNTSLFKGDVQFKYDDYSSYSDFINKVRMKIIVAKANVLMDDISFFAPSLKGWNERINMQGKISGTVSALKLKNIFLELGSNTMLSGTVELEGLPAFENTFIYADLKQLSTNFEDLNSITYPSGNSIEHLKIPEQVKALGDLSFSGEFTGFINEFVANGNLKTRLGEIISDVQLSVNKNEGHHLRGNINVPSFELGRFLANGTLGNISMRGVTHIGFGRKTNIEFNGNANSFEFNGYRYKNISVDASFHNADFKGEVSVRDKNLNVDFNGEVNMQKDSVLYNFQAQINKANLAKLKLIDRDTSLSISAKAQINLKGRSLDLLVGDAVLENVKWKEGLFNEDLGKIQFSTSTNQKGRSVNLKSEIVSANIDGDFSIEKFPQLIQQHLRKFAPNLVPQSADVQKNQRLSFQLIVHDFKPIQRLFLPQYFIEKNTNLTFNYSDKLGVYLALHSDSCNLPSVAAKSLEMTIKPEKEYLGLDVIAEKVYANEKVPLNHFKLKTNLGANNAKFLCEWNNDDTLKNNAHIGGDIAFKTSDTIKANLSDTYFYLQNRLWTLNNDNSLLWHVNKGEIKGLMLTMEDKSLKVNGTLGESDKDKLNLSFDGISLEFLKLILPQIKITGNVTGDVTVAAVLNKPKVTSELQLKDLVVNDQKFGETNIKTSYQSEEEKVEVDLIVRRITSRGENDEYLLKLNGDYFPFKDKDQLDCEIDFKNFRISLLQPYFKGVLSGINKAKVYGKLDVRGELASPVVLGELQFKDFTPTIDYLNVAYDLNDKVYFKEDGIYFENFNLKSTAPYYNPLKNEGVGTINGVITHNRFHDFYFNISIGAQKLIALNTDLTHNVNYYGRAFVTGDIMIGGSPSNIIMYANLTTEKFERNITTVDRTVLVLPLDQQAELPMYDFVEFINPNDTLKEVKVKDFIDVPWLDMALDIHVTPDATVKMIFDSRVGDEITASGTADMQFQINTNGKFTMNGTYEVDKGEYFFTLKNFLGKKFKVSSGGTVTWSGDPMEAEVDLKALYTVRTRVSSIMDPIKYTAQQVQEMSSTVPVDVVMYMKGNLWNPLTSLDLELSKANVRAQEIVADNIIGESEKTKQAVSLLMQGAFMVPENNGGAGAAVLNAGLSNAKQFLTGQVNNYLSQITGDVINVGFDYNGASDSLSNVSMNVSKNLYNDKVVISGTFDLGKDASDMEVQYKVSKNVTLKAFRKSQQNQKDQEGSVPTQGLGVFFRKEFDSFKELFQKKKKDKDKE